jgi:nucleoside-diphosphate kinase
MKRCCLVMPSIVTLICHDPEPSSNDVRYFEICTWRQPLPIDVVVLQRGSLLIERNFDQGDLVERTLVLLKPDAVARGLMGRVLQRFEDVGLKVVGMKMKQIDAELARKHYFDLEERFGKSVFDVTAGFMQSGPVVAMVLEGVEAVSLVRKLVGPTFPNQAPPGTIRGDFAHHSKAHTEAQHKVIANLIHASGNVEEAKYEVDLWFGADELYEYQTLAEKYTF